MSNRGNLYFDKMSETFEWEGGRFLPAIEAETPNCSYDLATLTFDGLDPDEVCKRFNYHDRLVEALHYLLDEHPKNGVYHDCTDNGLSECEYCEGRNLLKELVSS